MVLKCALFVNKNAVEAQLLEFYQNKRIIDF